MKLAYPFEQRTLDNGLRVIVSEDHGTPAVAVCLWYDVGARNEAKDKTGFAHLFEHIMFQGSRNVKGTDHFDILQSLGATLNGTTSFDRTNYFETVPSQHFTTALWLEADRMGTLVEALDQANLDNQRDVVKNERRQRYDNIPYGTMWERIIDAVFPKGHQYDHMPIGSMEHLTAASLQDCIDFWRTYYGPNNAVLSVVGDVDTAEAFAEVEKYFGSIPAIPEPARPDDTPIGPMIDPPRITFNETVPAERWVGVWRVPAAGTEEVEALNLAAAVLTTGQASRLTERLVRDKQVALGVVSGTQELIGGTSLFMVQVTARSGASLEEIESLVTSEIALLAESGPTERELERACALVESSLLSGLSTLEARADVFCEMTTLFGEPGRINDLVDLMTAPTAAEIQAAVVRHLDPANRAVFTYVIAGEEQA